ncbi:hypothetical protein MHBO_004142, partial [Bonamia ostreae]
EKNDLKENQKRVLEELRQKTLKLKNPFLLKENSVNANEIIKVLNFENKNYHDWRFSLDNLSSDLVQKFSETSLKKLRQNSEINRSMIYSYISVPQIAVDKIYKIISETKLDNPKFNKKYPNPHVTLIFKNHSNEKLWKECLRYWKNRALFKVVISGLAIWADKLVCSTCQIFSAEGKNMLDLVDSGHPHITIAHST